MQDQFYTFNMFDAQAWYARDVILGRIAVPSRAERDKDEKTWLDREATLDDAEKMIYYQGDYVKDLIEATDYPSFDVDGVNKTFMDWEHHKLDNIMGFRDNAYHSLMTGTMSPVHHTPWLEAMDDSMAAYLQTDPEAEKRFREVVGS
jgi:trimethylamine monooxygenase